MTYKICKIVGKFYIRTALKWEVKCLLAAVSLVSLSLSEEVLVNVCVES